MTVGPFLDRNDPRLPDLSEPVSEAEWTRRLHEYIRLRGFRVWRDPAELRVIVDAIVATQPKEVAAYRAGKTKLLGFLVAKVMVATRDGADPELATRLLEDALR